MKDTFYCLICNKKYRDITEVKIHKNGITELCTICLGALHIETIKDPDKKELK